MNTHTPGPWRANGAHKAYTVRDTKPGIDSTAIAEVAENEPEVMAANAHLLAAAPDLLSCLQDAEFLLRKAGQIAGPMQDSFRRSAEDARAAIAKAEGRAP